MMEQAKIGQTVNLLLNLVMSVVLDIAGQVVMGQYSVLAFFQTFCLTMGVGFLLGSYIPVIQIGNGFAGIFGLKNGVLYYMISTFAISVTMITCTCAISIFIQAGAAFMDVFKALFPIFLPVGTAFVELSLFWIQKFAVRLFCGTKKTE